MRTTMKRLGGIAVVLLVGALSVHAEIIEQIIVKVNGAIITKTELEELQINLLRQQGGQYTPEQLQNDAQLQEILAEITPGLIAEAVDELLVVQRGRALGYALGDEQFASILENLKQENNIQTDEQFEAALEQEGLTLEELRRSLEKQLLASRVQQIDVFSKISITEEEEHAYYEEHRQEFEEPAQITLREILISAPVEEAGGTGELVLNAAVDEAAREQIEKARARVIAGEAFDAVAAEVSDAPSKANGGLIGPLNPSELAPALQEILEGLEVGEVSEPIRTQRGYQLLKLESSAEASAPPFEQMREKIVEALSVQKSESEQLKLLEKLRSEAIIEWKNEDLEKAYGDFVAERSKASS